MAQTNSPLLITIVLVTMVLNSCFLVVKAHDESSNPLENVPMVPESRKFGQHHEESRASPSLAPEGAKAHHGGGEEEDQHASSTSETTSVSDERGHGHGHGPSPEGVHGMEAAHQHHHHLDGSVAGGGIIIAGLATAFVAAIFCYIRATRRTRQIIMNKEQLI